MLSETYSFGAWMAQHRKALDLTQRELAAHINCAVATIKKIELDERRPSRDLADALADALHIATDAHQTFVECARGLRPVDVLTAVTIAGENERRSGAQPIPDLPSSMTPLIGRSRELTQIADLLDHPNCRVLTIIGEGGSGKTRLALEAARRQREHFSDGAVFVSLTAVTDASLIPTNIAHGLKLVLSSSAEEQLFAYLRDKTLLLVLDNCEQLIEGMCWLSDLLANAPGIKVLATSRERLQLAEEWIYPVPLLDEMQAVDLFQQTAHRLNPQFQGSVEPATVAIVCQLVEHLPLAIELAAGWTPFLSCEQIAQNIRHAMTFLTTNVRNVPERHRSMRAVFDASWRLLSPAEQQVLMALAVFRGGWTVDEAEPVAGASLHMLRAFVDKSLVRVAGAGRYDMHELTRQYAADHLRTTKQEVTVRQRHAETYLALAETLDSDLLGPRGISAFARLDQEQDNLRTGLRWTLDSDNMDIARAYIDKLFMYWLRRGHWIEGERWAKAADARPGEGASPLLCWVVLHASVFLALQGRYAEAFPFLQRARDMALRLEDPETMMRVYFIQGQAALDLASAISVYDEFFLLGACLPANLKHGMATEAMLANGHLLYGDTLRNAGQHAVAQAHYCQSLDLYRQVGNVDLIAYAIGNLGRLALLDDRVTEAYNRFMESVALSRAIGNRVGIADWLQQLGNAAFIMGDLAHAESCHEEALALYQEMGNRPACADVAAELGYVALLKGDVQQSRQYLQESLSAYRPLVEMMRGFGHGWGMLARSEFRLCLRTQALLDITGSKLERALTLMGIAASLDSQFSSGVDLGMEGRVKDALATIQTHLSAETFTRVWESSSALSPEQIWAYISDVAFGA